MEQTIGNKQKHKKRRRAPNSRLAFVLVAAVLAVYLGTRIIGAFSYTYDETAPAVHVTANDSFMSTGWFFRDEIPVTGSTGDSMRHIVYSGERVQQDAPLALVYADDDALALSRQIEPLEKRIELLDAALQAAADGSDTAKLDQMITLSIQQMAAQVKDGSGQALSSSSESLRTLSLRHESSNIDTAAITTERDALSAELSSLEQQLSGRTTQLAAPSSGYFSEIVDGYENIMTYASLEDITIDSFHTMQESAETVDSSQMLGKIIRGFTWYLVAEIPVEQADRLTTGQSLRVNFMQASLEAPVTVYSIVKERGSDTALLVMEGTEFNSELVSMREQPIEIILATYSGLKVPKSAVRVMETTDSEGNVTQETGVYILSGAFSKFKIIEPLFEAEDYYVVKQSATNADMLVERDQIIVSGRNLQNNMVVRT